MVESTMEPLAWLRKQLEVADVDLLREMVGTFVQALMGAEADALCGAPYAANPLRFRHRRPVPPKLPTVAWINDPGEEVVARSA